MTDDIFDSLKDDTALSDDLNTANDRLTKIIEKIHLTFEEAKKSTSE